MDRLAYVSRADYRAWAEQQPRGRYERVDGRVVALERQNVGRVLLKGALWRALDAAVRASGLEAQAYGSGATVEVGEDTDYLPDAVVNVGVAPLPDDFAVPRPVVVAEICSSVARAIDTSEKLAGYFRVPSIQHFLVFNVRRPEVVHHRRLGGDLYTTVVTNGSITLDPLGVSINIDAMYRRTKKHG